MSTRIAAIMRNRAAPRYDIDPERHFKTTQRLALNLAQIRAVQRKLNDTIPRSCLHRQCEPVVYFDFIQRISHPSQPVFLFGGCVRDFVHAGMLHMHAGADLDINFTCSLEKVKTTLQEFRMINKRVEPSKSFFVLGDKRHHEKLEGTRLGSHEYRPETIEAPCNALLLCLETYEIIDLTGNGVADAKAKLYRAPIRDHAAWLRGSRKLLWRVIKFKMRGFAIETATERSVYRHYVPHMSKTELKKIWKILQVAHASQVLQILGDGMQRHGLGASDAMTLVQALFDAGQLTAHQ